MVVQAKSEKRKVEFAIIRYGVKAKIGIIEETVLWTGNNEELELLPEEVEPFREALETTLKKVLEYRCTNAMYYLQK